MNSQPKFNYLFVSDLHLSEGRNAQSGLIHRNEDFFEDRAFAEFIAYHVALSRNPATAVYHQKPWKLVINGDIFDFLQVTSLPEEGTELLAICDTTQYKDLRPNEVKFGLGTKAKEIVWKLSQVAQGHPLFFQALAWFLAQGGNELICMKGNHDIELYWPAVQHHMKTLLAEAYQDWYGRCRHEQECPLPDYDELPESLDPNILRSAVHFPPFHLYEPGLFYVEHGCQYDPANAFLNFDKPLLPHDPESIELPEGSLFVRYFFNAIENIHPFADNLKPISRYAFWLLRNAPAEIVTFVTDIFPEYWQARRQIRKKMQNKHAPTAPANPFRQELLKVQLDIQTGLKKNGRTTTWRMIASIIFLLAAILLALFVVRWIADGYLGLALVSILLILAALWGSAASFRSVDKLMVTPYLLTAAGKVARLLNGRPQPGLGPVRYHIFGHDHAAKLTLLDTNGDPHKPDFRQWYINTGSWIPVFNETEQLLRPSAHLTFLRLVPEKIQADVPNSDMPELLRWSSEAGKPLPVRLFSTDESQVATN